MTDDPLKKKTENNSGPDCLRRSIRQGWKNNKAPLFLLGSGATPIVIKEYYHAIYVINEIALGRAGNIKIMDAAKKMRQSEVFLLVVKHVKEGRYPTRPIQAEFFSELKKQGKLWELFCNSFLYDWIFKMDVIAQMKENDWKESVSSPEGKYPSKARRKQADNIDPPKSVTDIACQMYRSIREIICEKKQRLLGQNIILLTTNFDGAIPLALTRELNTKDEIPCIVVSGKEAISKIPHNSKVGKDKGRPWIITLRGDVYHVVCSNTLCSNYNKEISVFEALRESNQPLNIKIKGIMDSVEDGTWDNFFLLHRINEDDKNSGRNQNEEARIFYKNDPNGSSGNKNEISIFKKYIEIVYNSLIGPLNDGLFPDLKHYKSLPKDEIEKLKEVAEKIQHCPECGSRRSISISFPGYVVKDIEIGEIMSEIWRVLGSQISCVCTIGFSGNSDSTILDYLANMAWKLEIPWYNWGRKNKDTPTLSLLSKIKAVENTGNSLLKGSFVTILTPDGSLDLTESLKDLVD